MFTEPIDIDALCARAEALCRRIAPLDLGALPLYIVPQSRLPDELGGQSVCDGFTSPSLDLYLREVIGPAWRGRGPCMVIGDTKFSARMEADEMELAFFSIALHELAHIIERPRLYHERQGVDPMRLLFEALCVGRAVAEELSPHAAAAATEVHGLRFIRAMLHLRHRAALAGALIPLYGYCADRQYGLSHPNRYREALGDEPARLANRRIREILDAELPEAFSRLWAEDAAGRLSNGNLEPERSFFPCPSQP